MRIYSNDLTGRQLAAFLLRGSYQPRLRSSAARAAPESRPGRGLSQCQQWLCM
jgi:hypothetical protein